MMQLKCSRWTMLPTFSAARSNCFIFSGAFMALVYALRLRVYTPHSFCEIRVIPRDLPRDAAPQQGELLRRGPRRLADFPGFEIEPRGLAHLFQRVAGMHAFQTEA